MNDPSCKGLFYISDAFIKIMNDPRMSAGAKGVLGTVIALQQESDSDLHITPDELSKYASDDVEEIRKALDELARLGILEKDGIGYCLVNRIIFEHIKTN